MKEIVANGSLAEANQLILSIAATSNALGLDKITHQCHALETAILHGQKSLMDKMIDELEDSMHKTTLHLENRSNHLTSEQP